MKKTTITVARTLDMGGPFDVSAWALDTPGLAAWSNPGKMGDKIIKRSWQLMHIPSGMHVESAYKRSHLVVLADLLADVTDWTQYDIPSTDLARAVYVIRMFWAGYHLEQAA